MATAAISSDAILVDYCLCLVPATVVVAITAVAASTKAVDAIEVESLVGDWGFEVGAEKVYFRLPPPPGQWMQ